MLIAHDLIGTLGVACLVAGCGYELMALLAVVVWKLRISGHSFSKRMGSIRSSLAFAMQRTRPLRSSSGW